MQLSNQRITPYWKLITSEGFSTPISSQLWILFTKNKIAPAYCIFLCGTFLAIVRVMCELWGIPVWNNWKGGHWGLRKKSGPLGEGRLEFFWGKSGKKGGELRPGKPGLDLYRDCESLGVKLHRPSWGGEGNWAAPAQPGLLKLLGISEATEVKTLSQKNHKKHREEWDGWSDTEKPHYVLSAMSKRDL